MLQAVVSVASRSERCLGSMSEMRMCSDISSTGIISPVIGDFMYLRVAAAL
jgi:hypothetical protein